MRSVTRLDRVAGCALSAVDEFVPVWMRDGEAGFGGIITCGSVWACAVCSARIRQRRAEAVEDRARRWLAAGHGLLFVTLTRSHSMDDDLVDLLASVTDAWASVQRHRAFKRAASAAGYVGPLRATEITHGYNGWHPHLHLLLWLEKPLSRKAARAFEDAIAVLWLGQVDASREHGVKAVRVGSQLRDADAMAAYLTKLQDGYDGKPAGRWSAASEMLRGDLKKGRSRHLTPFQIAERAALGDKRAAALWRHYEAATKGRRCIQWGQKLAARLKVDHESDDASEVTSVEGVVVVELTRHEWNLVRGYSAEARLLDMVEREGLSGALSVVRACFARARFDHSRGRPPRSSDSESIVATSSSSAA